MHSRLSIEIKTLLEQKEHRMKRDSKDSDGNITAYSHNHSHTLKSSDSISTLGNSQSQISLIHDRYLTLEQDYQKLLDQTSQKNLIFQKQKDQLQKYRSLHTKNQKEIEQLKSLINIAKKTEHSYNSIGKSTLADSRVGRREKNGGSLPKERMTPITHTKSPLMGRQFTQSKESSGLKKMGTRQREKGQFARYKFVPTLVQ